MRQKQPKLTNPTPKDHFHWGLDAGYRAQQRGSRLDPNFDTKDYYWQLGYCLAFVKNKDEQVRFATGLPSIEARTQAKRAEFLDRLKKGITTLSPEDSYKRGYRAGYIYSSKSITYRDPTAKKGPFFCFGHKDGFYHREYNFAGALFATAITNLRNVAATAPTAEIKHKLNIQNENNLPPDTVKKLHASGASTFKPAQSKTDPTLTQEELEQKAMEGLVKLKA